MMTRPREHRAFRSRRFEYGAIPMTENMNFQPDNPKTTPSSAAAISARPARDLGAGAARLLATAAGTWRG